MFRSSIWGIIGLLTSRPRFRMIAFVIKIIMLLATGAACAAPVKFDFGSSRAAAGSIAVEPSCDFTAERGHGFEIGAKPTSEDRGGDPWSGDFLTANGGFCFSVVLPEGNHHVRVTLGDPSGTSDTTVKAESRRLMLENVITTQGEQVTKQFTVHIRRPEIKGGSRVGLKDREKPYLHWDDKLTLEFNGKRPCVAGIEITPAPDTTTVFLLGDSTVTDQPFEPWNSWGQMLPRFFKSGVAVANYAESGESLRSSLSARRVAKAESEMKKGDYVFVQFGHNDMKDKREGALEQYEADLTALVRSVRAKGAIPVLVTSMERKAGVKQETLGSYPATVRKVAAAEKTPLIDLQAMSRTLYAALGPNLDRAFVDGTHHGNFGSYQIARCVVEGLRSEVPELARHLAADAKPFNPAKPDDPDAFAMPASPMRDPAKPDGN
jgi:lysophospholipase L1-like esterase